MVRKKTQEEFEKELHDKHDGEYILCEGSIYKNALEKVKICHLKCGYIWDVRASHILHTSRCPNCNESKGEHLVRTILKELDVDFSREYVFNDLKNTKHLPFDFAVFKNRKLVGLIEYDGSQHFIAFNHFGGEEKLKKTQQNDRKKTKYCKNNNIPLLRLKYDLSKKQIEQEVKNFVCNIMNT